MNEKKIRKTEGLREITDHEAEAAKGGMKIMVLEKPAFVTWFLRLMFKVRDRK